LGWHGVVATLFGGSVVGSILGVIQLLAKRSDKEAEETASDPPSTPEPSLLRTELPFGPYLATAAVFYLFAAPWIDLHFRL